MSSAAQMADRLVEDLLVQGPIGFSVEGLAEFYGVSVHFAKTRLQLKWREVAYADDGRVIHPSYKDSQ